VSRNPSSRITHDRQLVRRLHQAYADKTEDFFKGLQQVPGSEAGVSLRTFGPARVLIARGHDWLSRATLTGEETFERIDEIVAHFAERSQICHIEWNPGNCHRPNSWNSELGQHLLDLGFRPGGFRCVYARSLGEQEGDLHSAMEIRRFGPGELEEYVEFVATVEAWSEERRSRKAANLIHGEGSEAWHHYVGFLDGKPCSVASLYTGSDTAFLEWSTTHSNARRRGCHGAMIRRRLEDAAAAGCDLAFTITDVGTQSGRNLQREGFRLAYNYVMLKKDP